ncbi:MBL fold metallo-hydrolase [Micromonospora sp. CB01531]|uniref:MBL fold metallo-hydrolase n=1 Tax=Micromonospora sp. CB01531 TaxID=1718947 RepID=UPI00093BBE78|nr:MBL fold metallo-hydrolase [Micromonospora sp. CB01531]OKI49285.1 MBL fold metallo-hydrolase [Micromonospora sp. CB01531]
MTPEFPQTGNTPALDRRKILRYAALGAMAVPAGAVLLDGSGARAAATGTTDGLPDYAPIPPDALGPALNANGYYVGQIGENLFWVTDSIYQTMFLTTRKGVVLVDAPPGIGHNLMRAIEDVTRANGRPSRVTHIIYSHYHADHISAAGLFSRVERIAHAETRSLLKFANDPNRPLPTTTFEDRLVLEVGGERLELAHHGPNHSPDNIFIYAPEYRTLMVADVLFPGWTPFLNLAVAQNIPAWIHAQDVAMSYPWKTLVGGHIGRLGTREDGELQRRYIADLQASARAVLDTLDITPYYLRYGTQGNPWGMVNEYFKEAVRQTSAPVVAKYTGKLAGVDVFTESHALVLFESLRIDWGVLRPLGIHP